MAAKVRNILRSYDYVLALAVIALSVFGVVMVYASANSPDIPLRTATMFGDAWTRQRLYVISGAVLMFAISFIDYRIITRFYLYIYGLMLALLVVVMIIGVTDATGVARWIWIRLPGVAPISMQPSEFAKLFIIIFLAKYLDIINDKFNRILWLLLTLVLIIVPVMLVVVQPSLSASLVVLFTSLTILFVAGLYYRTIIIGLGLLSPVAVFAWFDMQRANPIFLTSLLGDYQWRRIEAWRDARIDISSVIGRYQFMQTQQSLYAISSGGLTGRGFMNNSWVIHGHNDFIFSVVAEQFGFVGALLLLLTITLIIVRCIVIALRAPDMQGRFIAAGVAGMLIFETFVHVGVATNFLPNTGMPFPFMSFGGSMMWVHMMAIGVVLNIKIPRVRSIFNDEIL